MCQVQPNTMGGTTWRMWRSWPRGGCGGGGIVVLRAQCVALDKHQLNILLRLGWKAINIKNELLNNLCCGAVEAGLLWAFRTSAPFRFESATLATYSCSAPLSLPSDQSIAFRFYPSALAPSLRLYSPVFRFFALSFFSSLTSPHLPLCTILALFVLIHLLVTLPPFCNETCGFVSVTLSAFYDYSGPGDSVYVEHGCRVRNGLGRVAARTRI